MNTDELPVLKIQHYSEITNDYTGIVAHSNGTKWWFLKGEWHREDGPAYENANGDKRWYLNGKTYSFEDFFEATTAAGKEVLIWRMNEFR